MSICCSNETEADIESNSGQLEVFHQLHCLVRLKFLFLPRSLNVEKATDTV
jgi:hypothetical protein